MYENLSDDDIAKIAEGFSLDFVDFAKNHYGIDVDYSVNAIQHIEHIAKHLHETMPSDVEEELLFNFGKMLGSHFGEVFIRAGHAKWANCTTPDGGKFPGLMFNYGGSCYPWVKSRNRIANGDEDNLYHFAYFLIEKIKAQ